MTKLAVTGPGAGRLLDRLSAGAVDADSGRATYTPWLSEAGRIEADLTVTKLGVDDFLVVASDSARGPVLAMVRRAAPEAVRVADLTEEWAQLNVQGPASRAVLAELTDADLGSDHFPFRAADRMRVAGCEVVCLRLTYLGELGYELFVPHASALVVYDALVDVGAAHGLRPVGLKALSSLRLEKAYRDFGHDIDNTDCPIEVGLGFTLAWDTDFVGRSAVERRREDYRARGGPPQRLVQLRLTDPDPLLYHAEVVHRDGEPVGYVRSASYGWSLGGAVGLAMVSAPTAVTPAWLKEGEWSVDVAGTRYPAEVSLRPMYDPASARVRV